MLNIGAIERLHDAEETKVAAWNAYQTYVSTRPTQVRNPNVTLWLIECYYAACDAYADARSRVRNARGY